MSVSHNFTTQDPEIGLAKTNELADMPAADRAALTGSDLLTRYVSTGMRQRDFWRAHLADVMTFDAFHGRLYRARKGIRSQAHLFTHDLGAPWRLTGGGQNGRVRSGQQAAQEGVDVLCERVLVDVLRRRAAVGVAQARVLAGVADGCRCMCIQNITNCLLTL